MEICGCPVFAVEHLWVVYQDQEPYELDERISVIPLDGLPELCRMLRAG